MAYECQIVADSVNPNNEHITTFQITFPRTILAEFNTHKMLSKNSASSRAIPIEKMLSMVKEDPYIPVFTKNQSGMQGIDASTDEEFQREATRNWLKARDQAIDYALVLKSVGVHKQDCNRILEPWMWHTVIVTSTTWANFFALRTHEAAHPAIQVIAKMMVDAYIASTPEPLDWGDWHLPYIKFSDYNTAEYYTKEHENEDVYGLLCKMSTARCARVSYMRQNDTKAIEEDIALHDRLVGADPKHGSPCEHQAQANWGVLASGNFRGGWLQYRQTLVNQSTNEFIWKGIVIH